jgi:hypothetical protein
VEESYPAQASPEAQAALGRLAALIADPQKRRAFSVDARNTLEEAGVLHEHLPAALIDRFGSLSEDELTILGERCNDLMTHGFYVKLPDGGRLCLF